MNKYDIYEVSELTPVIGRQKSFYGKAHIINTGAVLALQSYDTIVCKIDNITGDIIECKKGVYSRTTDRHIKDFLYQFGGDNYFNYY